MHTHTISSCSEPPCRTRLAEVNPLWHLRACKLGFNQLFSLLHHPPAKRGEIQQSGKGIMLGLFRTVLGKAQTELQSPRVLTESLDTCGWDEEGGTVPLCCPCSWDQGSPWYEMCLAPSRVPSVGCQGHR